MARTHGYLSVTAETNERASEKRPQVEITFHPAERWQKTATYHINFYAGGAEWKDEHGTTHEFRGSLVFSLTIPVGDLKDLANQFDIESAKAMNDYLDSTPQEVHA